jgi:membrane-bound ClpP family serine protease
MDLMMLLMFSPLLGLALFAVLPFGTALQLYIPILAVGGFINFKMMRSMHLPVKTGPEEMIGEEAEVIEEINPQGKVQTRGEIWNARAFGHKFQKGDIARIIEVQGLVLLVEAPGK